ncbi:MAG: sugar nucleotide-binding protein [Candidatus Shapirobacteria bacterium]|nr:sugar nucleotide-binding protein [Candidatus Shapirobacteria bacterium]
MKIIGTGLSGLVGSRIVELNPDIEFVNISIETGISILDLIALEKVFTDNPDAETVLHLAAFTDTNAAWAQKGDKTGLCYQLNVVGTQNIINLCQKHGKYLVNISTDFVFDGTKEGKYTEEDTPNPIEWYGQTKYLAEKIVLDSGIQASIVRLAFPYRANFEPKKDLIRKIIDGFKTGKLYPQWTDHYTTPTFVDDIAHGLWVILDKQSTGIFHLAGSSSQSPFEMCQQIADVFGFDKNLIQAGTLDDYVKALPPGSRPWQHNLSLSNDKVTAMGIKMKTLREGLEEMKKQML